MSSGQEHGFGELRSLLQQPPSAEVWEALCALVFPAKWEKTADQWLPYAMDQLDRRWPDDLRVMPLKWSQRKRPPSALQLVRHLRHDKSAHDQLPAVLGLLERADAQLTTLTVWFLDTPRASQLLSACANPALRSVSLMYCDLDATLALGGLATARTLRIDNSPISDEALSAILQASNTPELRSFALRFRRPGPAKRLGKLLCASGAAARLESLELHKNMLTGHAELARTLAQVPWPALSALDRSGCACDPAGLRALLDAAPALRELRLSESKLSDEGVDELARAARSFTHLDLGYSPASAASIAALLEGERCAQLRSLGLRAVALGEPGGRALWRGQVSQTLERLELSGSAQLPAFWSLLDGASLPNLRQLTVRDARLKGHEARALASAKLPALDEIELSHARLDAEALAALEGAPWLPQVRGLWRHRPTTIPRGAELRIMALQRHD
jgi:hypothetical protein